MSQQLQSRDRSGFPRTSVVLGRGRGARRTIGNAVRRATSLTFEARRRSDAALVFVPQSSGAARFASQLQHRLIMSGHVLYAAFMRVALVRASVVLVAIGASSCTSSPKDAESSEVVGSATDPTGYETNSPASVMTSSDGGATDRETHNPATSSNPAATSRAGAESGDVPTSNQADDVGTARDRGTVKDFTGVEATSGERGETSSEASYASGTPSDDSASSLDDSSEGNAKPEPRPL